MKRDSDIALQMAQISAIMKSFTCGASILGTCPPSATWDLTRDAENPVVDVLGKVALDLVGHRLTSLDHLSMLRATMDILSLSSNM